MSPLAPPALILVTGASGFLGTYTVQHLVQLGFKVRATVRSEAKGEYVKSLYGVEYAVVPDMMAPGAYNEAVKGVDGVVHVASPLDTQNTGDPSLVIGPAVAGVTGLLESLLGTEVKRVVQISSVAAIAAGEKGVHTEAEWNEVAPAVCDKEGAAANGGIKYAASKALAERAFWKFFDQKRGFDGVSLNPGFVFGPPTQYAPGGEIVGSNAVALGFLIPELPKEALSRNLPPCMVDVRDVAVAAGLALTQDVGGERFIIAAAPLFGNDIVLAANKVPALAGRVIQGNPDEGFRDGLVKNACVYDGRKAEKLLGLKYRPKDETLEETVASLATKMT